MADDARSVVADTFRAFGLESLANWVMTNIEEDTPMSQVYIRLRETEEYKRRFPAMADLQQKAAAGGRGYTEGDYIAIENAYREVLSDSGLPSELWDSADDYAALMRGEVSAAQVRRRVDAAKRAVLSTNPATRAQLSRLYGITTQDLMAYALVPDRGADYIERLATTAILAGVGADAGLGSSLGAGQWEQYAGALGATDEQAARTAMSGAATLLQEQQRLAQLESDVFTDVDALDIAVKRDTEKALKSQRRTQREVARFSGSAGTTAGSLGGTGL